MNTNEIRRNAAQYGEYIAQEAAYTAENMSARTAGSVAEADASEYIAGKLTAAGAEVRSEEFGVSPAAAFGWIGVTVVCMMLAYVAYFFVAMVSVALIVVALVPFAVQGVFLSRAFDGAYISRTSHNVTAVLPCSGEVRRRVFFTAHADSARNFRPYVKGRHALVAAVAAVSLVGAAYLLGADIARWVYLGSVGTGLVRGDWLIAGLVGIVFVPFWGAYNAIIIPYLPRETIPPVPSPDSRPPLRCIHRKTPVEVSTSFSGAFFSADPNTHRILFDRFFPHKLFSRRNYDRHAQDHQKYSHDELQPFNHEHACPG